MNPTRRDVFRTGALASAAAGLASTAAGAAVANEPNPYSRVGVRPFINCTATVTRNGGSLTLPEVIQAIERASHYHVNLDELQEKVGERLAQLLKCESAIVTSGAAAALTHATAACLAGADPERIQQLPGLSGLKSEVIMPKWSRNQYDQAIRMLGVRIVEVETRDQLHNALSHQTAMMAMLGDRWKKEAVGLDELAEASHKTGVPVLVDAAADPIEVPSPYITRGASLVAHSGGKIIRGPQTAGLLFGRKDLIRAAFLNAAHHHAFGRPMKVSKEEVMGMLAAVEVWVAKRNLEAEYREWESWYTYITEQITKVEGVRTRVRPPTRGGPFPALHVEWDTAKLNITAGQIGRRLLEGEPRIMTHAEGDNAYFLIRPAAMKPGEYKEVARRLYDIFSRAPRGPRPAPKPPAFNIAGQWEVELNFDLGSARHTLFLETQGNRVAGAHLGTVVRGELSGEIEGDQVRLKSVLPFEGSRLTYEFAGAVSGDRISGEVDLGEYGKARFTASRYHPGSRPAPRDPSRSG